MNLLQLKLVLVHAPTLSDPQNPHRRTPLSVSTINNNNKVLIS